MKFINKYEIYKLKINMKFLLNWFNSNLATCPLRSSFSIGVVCGGHVGSVMVPYRPGVRGGHLWWYPIASAVRGGCSWSILVPYRSPDFCSFKYKMFMK